MRNVNSATLPRTKRLLLVLVFIPALVFSICFRSTETSSFFHSDQPFPQGHPFIECCDVGFGHLCCSGSSMSSDDLDVHKCPIASGAIAGLLWRWHRCNRIEQRRRCLGIVRGMVDWLRNRLTTQVMSF
ncbi:hypothetical protein BDZ97DRAFT_1799304 [Flammula alnicola]|nr:hypothetical protein BDZ97DRAFT_1799304 [Flammula alnicola]